MRPEITDLIGVGSGTGSRCPWPVPWSLGRKEPPGRGSFFVLLIRCHGALASAVLCAFDLLEFDGRNLRREPIEERKRLLAQLLKGSHLSIVLNEHYEEHCEIVFREACKFGSGGIVSKLLGSIYRWGRSPYWVKVKNPYAPAVKREVEENWGWGLRAKCASFGSFSQS